MFSSTCHTVPKTSHRLLKWYQVCGSANTLEGLTIVYWVSVLDHDCQVHLALSLALKGVGSIVRTGGHPVAATRPSHDVAPRHKARATALDVCTRNHWNKLKERVSLQDIDLNCTVKWDIYTSIARRLLYLWWPIDHYVNFLPKEINVRLLIWSILYGW